MRPIGAGSPVPDDAALDVVLPREEPLADAEHHPPAGDARDQIDAVHLVEAVDRVLVVDVQDQHVAAQHVTRVDPVEQRLRHERDRDPLPEVGAFTEHVLPGADDAGQGRVAGEVGEAHFLGARRAGREGEQQGEARRARRPAGALSGRPKPGATPAARRSPSRPGVHHGIAPLARRDAPTPQSGT